MTVMDAILEADEARPSAIPIEKKVKWIERLEQRVYLEVLLTGHEEVPVITWPDDSGYELTVKAPYDEIYPLYLMARIDFEQNDSSNYADSSERFDNLYRQFIRWFASTYSPAQGYLF